MRGGSCACTLPELDIILKRTMPDIYICGFKLCFRTDLTRRNGSDEYNILPVQANDYFSKNRVTATFVGFVDFDSARWLTSIRIAFRRPLQSLRNCLRLIKWQ